MSFLRYNLFKQGHILLSFPLFPRNSSSLCINALYTFSNHCVQSHNASTYHSPDLHMNSSINSTQNANSNLGKTTLSGEGEKWKHIDQSTIHEKWLVSPNPLNPLDGIAEKPFDEKVANILQGPLDLKDIEVKPDGILYLPEIKYRRILNDAFGPGSWALIPRGPPKKNQTIIFQEYALYAQGRFISQAYGEQSIAGVQGRSLATAYEGAKSNALMRCCKDIGVASELWDPEFISNFKSKYLVQKFVKNLKTNQTTKLWRRIDRPPFSYPFEELQ